MKTTKDKRTIVCPECRGTGFEYERDGAYDSKKVPCKYCNGLRVIFEVLVHESIEAKE